MTQVELSENAVVAERLASNHSVSSTNVSAGEDLEGDLQAAIMYQKDAPDDLKVVSWPKNRGIEDVDELDYYAYERMSGQRSVIYIIEEGIDPSHTVGRSP